METIEHISLKIDLQQVLTTEQAWHYNIVPKSADERNVEFYVDETQAFSGLKDELEIMLGKSVVLEKAPSAIVQKALSTYYRRKAAVQGVEMSVKRSDDFLLSLIREAKTLGSSDIHIEIYEDKCRVRIRIDGALIERYTISKGDEYSALINKIKIKANLDIAEKRLPQDGRMLFSKDGYKFDIRVSVLPTLQGEKVVLRLLSNDATDIDIHKIGFNENELIDYLDGVKRSHGIVLISGPTGSGKTTTLYATLKLLNKETTNILTVEDPIEYTLPGINQVQLKESIGLTFASALKTFLRQDPDIIMLGEIRDGETAQMAIRASLTGHLVLSTIHTNSAWGTISRLVDMGVPPFLIASTLNVSIAQRLVRLLCNDCKKKEPFDLKYLPKSYKAPHQLTEHFVACGCEHCHFTGYKGRRAIFEVIPIDFELAEKIKNNIFAVSSLLEERKIKTLDRNAFEMLEKGETSADEVYSLLLNL